MLDLTTQESRKVLIDEMSSKENKDRKATSMVQYDVFNDRLDKYVQTYLRSQFSDNTVNSMPIVSSINLAKRIVNQEASIYKTAPKRTFVNADEKLSLVLNEIYQDGKFDVIFAKSNTYFKLQNQNLLQVVLKNGKLSLRSMLGHHYDVIPKADDPESAEAYIISAFDKSLYLNSGNRATPTGLALPSEPTMQSDGVNQSIAESDDYMSVTEKYVVWTDGMNFIMDKNGAIISGDDVVNPLFPKMPFVDIAVDKNFTYFVEVSQSIVDFTIQYNGAMSDLGNVVRLQGWAQGYLKGPADLIPENIQIGPNYILKLVIDPNNQTPTEFGYANPSPDLQGSIAYIEMLLANFISSRGIDPKIVSGKADSTRYSSGVERLLAMIDKFEAARSDYALYKNAEEQVFEIIKQYLNVFSGTEFLDQKYWVNKISGDVKLNIEYAKPESIKTDDEVIATIQKKIELGLMSRVSAMMELRGMDRDAAIEELKLIDAESLMGDLGGEIQDQTLRV